MQFISASFYSDDTAADNMLLMLVASKPASSYVERPTISEWIRYWGFIFQWKYDLKSANTLP